MHKAGTFLRRNLPTRARLTSRSTQEMWGGVKARYRPGAAKQAQDK